MRALLIASQGAESTNQLKYYRNPTGGLFRSGCSAPRIRCMDFPLLIGVNVLFVALTTLLWTEYANRKKAKGQKKEGGRREEIDIDPASVPEFKPSWPESR